MKQIIALALLVLITACGSGGGGGSATDPGSVIVKGNIYNPPAGKPSMAPAMGALTFDRLASVSTGSFIVVSTEVINKTALDLVNIRFEVGLEMESMLTKEYWSCMKCYPYDTGQACNGMWEVYGGTLTVPIAPPAQPVCDATYAPQPTSGYCLDTFDPGHLDCSATPTYKISYNPPGSGYSTGSGLIALLKSGATFSSASGWGGSAIGVKTDCKAYWIVTDSDGKELARKDYLIDVVP